MHMRITTQLVTWQGICIHRYNCMILEGQSGHFKSHYKLEQKKKPNKHNTIKVEIKDQNDSI